MTKLNNEGADAKVVIGELTSIRIGLIILLLGGVVTFVRWAATTSSKLDVILTNQATQNASIVELKSEYDEMKYKQIQDEADIKQIKSDCLMLPTTK